VVEAPIKVDGLRPAAGARERRGRIFAVVPTDEGRMRRPIIPAGVLGVLVGVGADGALNYVWPVALVGAGCT
jgi:hypothetical protein